MQNFNKRRRELKQIQLCKEEEAARWLFSSKSYCLHQNYLLDILFFLPALNLVLQDIFERIDNYRGGEGEVKLKDLVLFLRGVYDNIDDNFEVDLVNSTILSTHIVHEKS